MTTATSGASTDPSLSGGSGSSLRRFGSIAFRLALLGLGISAVVWLVEEAGTEDVLHALTHATGYIVVAFLIEAVRILLELLGSIALIRAQAGKGSETRERRHLIPFHWLLRTHLVSYALCMALPAGRAASETYKIIAFRPFIGTGPATAVGTSSQGLNLVANAVVSVPAAIAAFLVTGAGTLTLALCAHALISMVSGLGVLLLARSAKVAGFLERFSFLREPVRAFRAVQHQAQLLPPFAAAAIIGGRAMQVVQFGVLAAGVGLGTGLASGPAVALLTHGVQAVGSMAGDLVPGQVGVTEGAFRLAASAFGSSAAVAVSVALISHAVQLSWIVIGSLVPVLWPAAVSPPTEDASPS